MYKKIIPYLTGFFGLFFLLLHSKKTTKNKQMKKFIEITFLTTIVLFIAAFSLHGQENATPKSFSTGNLSMQIPQIKMPLVDRAALLAEDVENSKNGHPLRIGIVQDVQYTMNNIGRTDYLPDGSLIWRASFKSPGATGMSIRFSEFDIPDGAELFVYTPDQELIDGSYTNQTELQENILHTEDLAGEEIIVEYFEPAGVSHSGSFTIVGISHLYKNSFTTKGPHGNAEGNCHINVMCPEVEQWMDQVNAVVCIKIAASSGTYLCTGSMINNTRNDKTPYVLTAAHCWEPSPSFTFYFYYQIDSCGATSGSSNIFARNATIRAIDHEGAANQMRGPDFMLLEIVGLLSNKVKEKLFFSGWDRSTSLPAVGAAIHHPGGDYKKYSLPRSYGTYYSSYYWQVYWWTGNANKGVTEGGSSGSPLINAQKRIVGMLSRGSSSCSNTSGTDIYGKFSASWAFNSTDESKMLKCWLDPDNTGVVTLDGIPYIDPEPEEGIQSHGKMQNIEIYPNPSTGSFTVKGDFKNANLTCNVYNILGTLVHSEKVNNSKELKLNLDLTNGVYFIKIEDKDKIYTSKLVISK